MTTESAAQIRERHIRDMGPKLGPVYHLLWNDVAWLHAKWKQYRDLYARSPERVEFLNSVAGHFFEVVQLTLHDDVLLHLARLTDPPKSAGKDNLTLQRLPELVPEPELATELKGLVQAACKACESARSSRHQRIAHTDLAFALASTFDPVPSRADVEAALRAIRVIMDRVEAHFWQSEKTLYRPPILEGFGAESLVDDLLMGVRAEKATTGALP